MRQDQRDRVTAATIVNEAGADELADIFWKFGGEERSRQIARAVARERETHPFQTTRQLAGLIEKISPRAGRKSIRRRRFFRRCGWR